LPPEPLVPEVTAWYYYYVTDPPRVSSHLVRSSGSSLGRSGGGLPAQDGAGRP